MDIQAKPRKKRKPTTKAVVPATVEDGIEDIVNGKDDIDNNILTVLPVLTRHKINVKKARQLREKGLSFGDIAKYFNCSKSAVHAALKRFGIITERIKVFRENRADALAEMQERILSSIDLASIKKASMPARVLAMAQLYDKERLERDLSTANIANLHDDIANLKSQKTNERSIPPKT